MERITSTQNPRVKEAIKLLEKPAARREAGLIIIEGRREITFAVKSGVKVMQLFWCPEVSDDEALNQLLVETDLELAIVIEVNIHVLEKLAYRESSQGFVAIGIPKSITLDELQLPAAPLILVLESVEKPGNLGAMLRTADAAALDAVIICEPRCDLYNPNAIRASVGTVFTLQVVTASTEETIAFLKEKKIKTFAASLKAEKNHFDADFTGSTAFVMGTEADGLSESWHSQADEWIKIPMRGAIDSLNVSTSAAVLVFEAVRQRLMC
jgi:RNA methyltransferase, TrmH family